MATTITLESFEIVPINPDGTVNTLIPAITSPSTVVNKFCMGQRVRMKMRYHINGTINHVSNLFVRYNPAMWVAEFSAYSPNLIPPSGYTLVIPNDTPATYPMALVLARPEAAASNENGNVFLEVLDSDLFEITHNFRMTFDTEDYLTGTTLDNRFRLTKNSQYAVNEDNIERSSVYGFRKGLNCVLALKKNGNLAFAQELSIPFIASFAGFNVFGERDIPCHFEYSRVSSPTVQDNFISPFEDTKVTLVFDDPDERVITDETFVILCIKDKPVNVAGYEKDLELSEVKLVTTASTGSIGGVFKGPVAYSHTSGETKVSFVIDSTKLQFDRVYDLHFGSFYRRASDDVNVFLHDYDEVTTLSDSKAIDFDIESDFWSRNGRHANDFTATVMERLRNVLRVNYGQYNESSYAPYSTFDNDVVSVSFELKNAITNAVFYEGQVIKTPVGLLSNNQIEVIKDTESEEYYFSIREFRVPYLNENNLPDFGPNAIGSNIYRLSWKILFIAQGNSNAASEYLTESLLSIRPYENTLSSGRKVDNIRFLDPNTGLPLGDWCEFDEMLVAADIDGLTSPVYVTAFVDSFPLGVIFVNDLALEEENVQAHTLPSYVTFEQKTTDLISEMDASPTNGVITFLLNVSQLTNDQKRRISVMAYNE